MSTAPNTPQHEPTEPSRRDRLKPLELLGFSGVLAVFAGVIIFFATRDWTLALAFAVVAFIVSVVVVALVGLGGKPSDEDLEARKDLKHGPGSDWH